MGQQTENLTNEELITQLQARNDLSPLEHELLDRLIRAMDAIADLEYQVPACGPATTQELVAQ